MIVTDRFVFVHVHKTGGQFLNEIIARAIPAHRTIGYHLPLAEVPAEAAHLPVVGAVRNPWDWYVSWYAFNTRGGINNPLFRVVSNDRQEDFKATVTNLIQLGSGRPASVEHRETLLRLLPGTLDGNRGVGLTRDSIRELAGSGRGYYSWLFDRMLGSGSEDRVLIARFENLQQDFLAIMERLSVRETEVLRQEFGQRERRNVSRHSHYSHYYDEECKELVADMDEGLAARFGYEFASVKPTGAVYAFPNRAGALEGRKFRKLLGRERNFLRLNDDFDVAAIRNKLEQYSTERWRESERERLFDVHRDTQALQLVHFEDRRYEEPDYRDLYAEFQDELKPVIDYVADYYQDNGFIVRLILAKLASGGRIPRHTDAGYSLLNCHRIHLPITTNDGVLFHVGGEEIHMRTGELWEINNGTVHGVENRGAQDRIHLILDWMPNEAGLPAAAQLAADQPEGADCKSADAAMLAPMIERAHRLQQSGQLEKAESLYRQVLHFDADHVIANNLMGLLCLQTKRFDEAVQCIERGLSIAPNDAQAEANLGLALHALQRPEDAAVHFHKSLQLSPNSPKVYNNLGNIYFRLRRINDAIVCYRQALAIQPRFAEVHYNLGNALMVKRQYAEAAVSLQQCLALQPDFPAGRRSLERVQQRLAALGIQ